MNNFGFRVPGAMGGMYDLANFVSRHQTATGEFSVMSCGSSKIDRGARGWDRGARIFLPPSLLDIILKMQDSGRTPVGEVMIFEVKNRDAVVHVGVQAPSSRNVFL